MTTSEPSQEEPPTSMTSENFSLPPLVSSQNCELSLSSENVRKDLEKNKINERQSHVLAKGEVEMRKKSVHSEKKHQIPSEIDQALNSTVKDKVSNDEIIEKKTRE